MKARLKFALTVCFLPSVAFPQMRSPTDDELYGEAPWEWVPYAPGEASFVYLLLLFSYLVALVIQIVGARKFGFDQTLFSNMLWALWWLPIGFIVCVLFLKITS